MEVKHIKDLEKKYDLELDKVVKTIKSSKAPQGGIHPERIKLVLLQFPDGLKPYATAIVDYLEEKTNSMFLIWLGDCFGACDVPNLGEVKIDLIIQFGHNDLMPSI